MRTHPWRESQQICARMGYTHVGSPATNAWSDLHAFLLLSTSRPTFWTGALTIVDWSNRRGDELGPDSRWSPNLFVTVRQLLPLVLVGFGMTRKLDLSRWLVAIFRLAQLVSALCSTGAFRAIRPLMGSGRIVAIRKFRLVGSV
jgi:hypothetical protein